MKSNAWLIFLGTATLEVGAMFLAAWVIWINLTQDERILVAGLWISHTGMPILAGLFLVLLLGLVIHLMFRWYIIPLRAISEETRIIAVSNAGHRLTPEGRPEIQDLSTSINLLAKHYETIQNDVKIRIQEANAALAEEKNTLATLISKLAQGIVVCNHDSRILLYNQYAQTLLDASSEDSGETDWIGLGRSVHDVLDKDLVNHALSHIDYRLQQGDTGLMVPFIASRPGGRLLSIHLVPILDNRNTFSGYILTLEDITRRTAAENRRGLLLNALTEGQRSGIAGIRAAIETILDYPDMDEISRHQFHTIIREESLKLSNHLDQLETDYSPDLNVRWPLEETLASELLAVIERRSRDTIGIMIKMSVPREPLWLKADSYAIVQSLCFVMNQLGARHQATNLELKLESQAAFASIVINWKGATVDMEVLRSWNQQAILKDRQDRVVTLQDVVERHGATVWTDNDEKTGRHSLHILLPTVEGQPVTEVSSPEQRWENYYDFQLFDRQKQRSKPEELALTDLTCTALDTETTGLYPSDGDEIIAIGAIRIVNGRILKRESFDCLIKPRQAISKDAMAVHGISPEMLRSMPSIEEVLPKFYRFVADTVIVGHIIGFDMRFFELVEERTGIHFNNKVLDTLQLSQVIHPNQSEQSMEAIAKRLGVSVTGRHTALGDALTTAQIFLALIPLLSEHGIQTLQQALAACDTSELARVKY